MNEAAPATFPKEWPGTTPGPDVTLMYELGQRILESLQAIQAQLSNPQPAPTTWLSGDEACLILGIGVTPSGSHLRRLNWLRRQGFLTRFGSERPYTYDKDEVYTVLARIRDRKLFIPTKL